MTFVKHLNGVIIGINFDFLIIYNEWEVGQLANFVGLIGYLCNSKCLSFLKFALSNRPKSDINKVERDLLAIFH